MADAVDRRDAAVPAIDESAAESRGRDAVGQRLGRQIASEEGAI